MPRAWHRVGLGLERPAEVVQALHGAVRPELLTEDLGHVGPDRSSAPSSRQSRGAAWSSRVRRATASSRSWSGTVGASPVVSCHRSPAPVAREEGLGHRRVFACSGASRCRPASPARPRRSQPRARSVFGGRQRIRGPGALEVDARGLHRGAVLDADPKAARSASSGTPERKEWLIGRRQPRGGIDRLRLFRKDDLGDSIALGGQRKRACLMEEVEGDPPGPCRPRRAARSPTRPRLR